MNDRQAALKLVEVAANGCYNAEERLKLERKYLRKRIREAAEAGASYRQIAKYAKLSHQRISQLR
jgi:hypothetical protein